MKKFSTVVLFLLIVTSIKAQNLESDSLDGYDTTKFRLRNTTVTIVSPSEEEAYPDTVKLTTKRRQRYDHFNGIDFGVNGFLSDDNSFDLQEDAEFLELDYAKSWYIAVNFLEKYIPIAHEKFGISTGLGVEANRYFFDKEITLVSTGDTTIGITDITKNISKNKMNVLMLNWPLFLETNLGKDALHSFHLAIGGMLSYRLRSRTMQKFRQNGEDFKVRNRTDFNMNPFRLNAVVRLGYGDFTVFASYGLTSVFDDDKGPEVFPFTAGVSLLTW